MLSNPLKLLQVLLISPDRKWPPIPPLILDFSSCGYAGFVPGNAATFQPWLVQSLPVNLTPSKSTEMIITLLQSCVWLGLTERDTIPGLSAARANAGQSEAQLLEEL